MAEQTSETEEPPEPALSLFDKFATAASRLTSRAVFFGFCVLLVLLWAPSFLILDSIDTWQLVINTITTIVTFLLVALLQNTQRRSDDAIQHKLNAIADALADLMDSEAGNEPRDLRKDRRDLINAVGLEERTGT